MSDAISPDLMTPRYDRTHVIAGTVAVLAFVVVVARCAWVSDDAYITLRTVDNALNGLGLRWDPAERVQTYTHPLWMGGLLVAHALTGEAYYGTLALSGLVAVVGFGLLLLGIARSARDVALGATLLLSSKAFVDYCTSGLENPLTHLLLVGFAVVLLRRQPGPRSLLALTLLASLLGCTRLDALLLVAPAWGLALARARGRDPVKLLVAVALGALPLVLWEAFALLYYGFPFPNTAYAKLGSGIPRGELIAQSRFYFEHLALFDSGTVGLLLAGMLAAAEPRRAALAAGAVLYLAYVVWIGGDFMAGRFFSAPALLAGILLLDRSPPLRVSAAVAALALAVGLANPYAPLRSGPHYRKTPPHHGVVDERGYYHRASGLLGPDPDAPRPDFRWVQEGREARERGGPSPQVRPCVGFFGYFAGPTIRVVDRLALTDPLLARLPAAYDPSWRIGHFRRQIPEGYLDTRGPEENRLADPELARLYDRLALVTRGPLLDAERLRAIWELNTGQLGVDPQRFRFPNLKEIRAPELARGRPGGWRVPERGLSVLFASAQHAPRIEVQLVERGRLRLLFVRDGQVVGQVDASGAGALDVDVPRSAVGSGYEQVFVFTLGRDAAVLRRLATREG